MNSSDKLKESEANEPTEGATENVEVIENNNDNNTEPDAKSATTGNKQEDTIVRKQMIVQFNMTLMTLQLMKLIIQKSLERNEKAQSETKSS